MNQQTDSLGQQCEVRASFHDSTQMQAAVNQLTLAGFDRADLTLPARGHSLDEPASEAATKPVATDEDARQARTLGASTAASAAALAAAGLVVATGGAAIPAVAGALLAGGAAGGATWAATEAGAEAEQHTRDDQAAAGHLVLAVRTTTAERIEKARTILGTAGGTDIETVGA
ncbi:MAG: hypothetical protein U1E70_17030 [Acetobacteraceae bacterium]|nr:hypothetical protein [Pseudomonadota bacterium]